MNLNTLEYYSYKTGTWQRGYLRDCFVLAIVDKAVNINFKGLNICAVIEKPLNPIDSEPYEMKEALDEHFKRNAFPFNAYLIGENGIKIPLLIGEGNDWSENRNYGYEKETCCYFGYVHPLIFGNTEKVRT